MSAAHVIYHIARADFLERVRRYSYLVMLILTVYFGYQTAAGNDTLKFGGYRGEYNSAWAGAMMSLVSTFSIGCFGFYLVKGTLEHDRRTGVGQIIATTPIHRLQYIIGKWVSNCLVLMSIVGILALAGIAIQFFKSESTNLDLFAFFSPFLFIVVPLIAVTSAAAVLFETIPLLAGGFGNIVYFFACLCIMMLFVSNETFKQYAAYDPLGFSIIENEIGRAVNAAHPNYNSYLRFLAAPGRTIGIFTWKGVKWTAEILFARFVDFSFAIGGMLLATLFFDRFDPSRRKPRQIKTTVSPDLERTAPLQTLSTPHLTPFTATANRFCILNVLIVELKLLIRGRRWWWYISAAGLISAGLVIPTEYTRNTVLLMTWIWPILIWSGMGNREIRQNTQQMVFASADPVWRQLPAQWLAGFLLAVLTGSGVAVKLFTVGDTVGLLAWLSGALFIPSLALAFGVWSNTTKLFEVVYLLLWYVGPFQNFPGMDYLGAHGSGNIGFFLPLSVFLIATAFVGRARRLGN